LAEMNQMDREAREQGIPLSDYVNANGIIIRGLAERLDGGSRFFDPEKLRGKMTPPPGWTPPRAFDELRPKGNAWKFLSRPSPEPKPKAKSKPKSEAKPEPKPKPEPMPTDPSISAHSSGKLDRIVKAIVGDHDDAARHFKQTAIEAWKVLKTDAEEH